jgi:hypothetical protein
MKKLNDNQNQPLRFECDGKVIGQFYNSWDKTYHLAEYEPYKRLPTVYTCGRRGNFSGDRYDGNRLLCADCWAGFEA